MWWLLHVSSFAWLLAVFFTLDWNQIVTAVLSLLYTSVAEAPASAEASLAIPIALTTQTKARLAERSFLELPVLGSCYAIIFSGRYILTRRESVWSSDFGWSWSEAVFFLDSLEPISFLEFLFFAFSSITEIFPVVAAASIPIALDTNVVVTILTFGAVVMKFGRYVFRGAFVTIDRWWWTTLAITVYVCIVYSKRE